MRNRIDTPTDELEISTRVTSVLREIGAKTVRDIICKTEKEMLLLPNFGVKSLREMKDVLSELGLHFGILDIQPSYNGEEEADEPSFPLEIKSVSLGNINYTAGYHSATFSLYHLIDQLKAMGKRVPKEAFSAFLLVEFEDGDVHVMAQYERLETKAEMMERTKAKRDAADRAVAEKDERDRQTYERLKKRFGPEQPSE